MVVQSGAASVDLNSRQINFNYRMLPTRTLYGVVDGSDDDNQFPTGYGTSVVS